MSIIEKALDKSAGQEEPRKRRARPKEPPLQNSPPQSTPTAGRDERVHAEPPLLDPLKQPLIEPDPAPTATKKRRPEVTRKTLKQVTLNLARLNAAGIITPDSRRAELVEQFRAIKRPLLMKAAQSSDKRVPKGNLVLVTSAVPREGKTFTAVNLAMSIAMELDHTVLLVDADVAKSDVSRLLGIQESEGLADYLAQPERSLSELLITTDIPKLAVLPAGRQRTNITELLASDHMRNLVDEFGRRYPDRIVVIDSPPLLAASGASVLAHLVGQTVLVVEAIRTPQSAVREALSLLTDVRNVGLVLNKNRGNQGLVYQYGSYYAHSSDVR